MFMKKYQTLLRDFIKKINNIRTNLILICITVNFKSFNQDLFKKCNWKVFKTSKDSSRQKECTICKGMNRERGNCNKGCKRIRLSFPTWHPLPPSLWTATLFPPVPPAGGGHIRRVYKSSRSQQNTVLGSSGCKMEIGMH